MATHPVQHHPVIIAAIIINAAVLALAFAWNRMDAAALGRLLIEDGLVEWMQFLCFIVIAALLAFVTAERAMQRSWLRLDVIGLAGLTVLVAVAAFEEISWFQRVLRLGIPDFFRQNNLQGETNLHNLAVGSASLHKAVLLKLIFIAGILHNLVLPLLARSRPAIRHFVESLGLYLPPLSAAIIYLVLVLLSHLLVDHPRKGELGEMFGAVHYLATVFAAYLIGVGYGRPAVFSNPSDARRISALFVLFMGFMILVAWLLSAAYIPLNAAS